VFNNKQNTQACNAQAIGNKGTFFAWHGSQVARWHMMIRTGLRNLSGTKLQAFGVAYGAGIYFAKDLNTSMGYANNSCKIWPNLEFDGKSLKDVNVRCAAMCEIVNRPEDFTSINPYYVVPNEDYITTRFVFLFKNNPTSVNAMDVQIPKQLMKGLDEVV
jgi:ubiquitin-conjugating enzyme E2 Q